MKIDFEEKFGNMKWSFVNDELNKNNKNVVSVLPELSQYCTKVQLQNPTNNVN